ncbi:CASP8 and FADD-like apoptosis regulator [Hoplias malabaricus]|uniref:CASP8 and FADD-like apoptosis regulator n=1 Tax=Hoplias malabaricus TaxID=27720 RepID=UPI0034623D14
MAEVSFLQVNSIMDSLSKEECKTLLYLCSDLISADCVEDCRGALLTLITQAHTQVQTRTHHKAPPGDVFLKEVLFRLRRFDILKQILGSSRKEVEEMLKKRGHVLSDYRVLMMELSENLEEEDLKSLIFLLKSSIPRGPLHRATNFLDVVVELEKMEKVSCEKLELIEQSLKNIRRLDLVRRIQSYQRGQHGNQQDISQRAVTQNNTQFGFRVTHQSPVRTQQIEEFENLKLSVEETGAQQLQVSVDQYHINKELQGVCLIIDCIGSDGNLLKGTFQNLGFQVELYSLQSVREVESVVKSVVQTRALQQGSVFCCCFMSRGMDTDLVLSDLRRSFGSLLVGKPKLFFTQIYTDAPPTQGYNDPFLETDGKPFHPDYAHASLPATADVLWNLCTTGAWLLQREGHCSVYLRALRAALLRAHQRKLHVLDALTEVDRDVKQHNQRNPNESYHITLSHTLRKSLYL